MLDEMEGRLWTRHGKVFGDQLSALLKDAWRAFQRGHAIVWYKPWEEQVASRAAVKRGR